MVAGAVAFTGTTAAQADGDAPSIDSAVEYDGTVDVVFERAVVAASDGSPLAAEDFVVTVDGTDYQVTDLSVASGSGDGAARYTITELDGPSELSPVDDASVTVADVRVAGDADRAASELTEEIEVTSETLNGATSDHGQRSDAATVLLGEPIAVRNTATVDDGFEIRDLTDSQTILRGSLGWNATTLAYESANLDAGHSYRIGFDDGTEKYFNVTSLSLSASAADVTTRENLTVDVETTWGNRPVTAELVGENETRSATLDGQGEATVDFGTLGEGTYTVNVTDEESGIEASTGPIEVHYVAPGDVEFGDDAYVVDEVGDVAEIPIDLENTDTAEVRIGTEDDGYWIDATAEDEGDGTVTLLFNTTAAGTHGTNEVLTVDDAAESDSVSVRDEGGDFRENNDETDAGDAMLDPAQYEMVVEAPGGGDDIGTLDLNEPGDGSAEFRDPAYYTEETGDVADIPIELSRTDTADLRIGSRDDGYVLNATVRDEDRDDEVTVSFDTYTAGTHDEGNSVVTASGGDAVTAVEEAGDFDPDSPDAAVLDPAQYELAVEATGGEDLGTLHLNSPSDDSLSVSTAPKAADPFDWTATDYRTESGNSLTETGRVAEEDHLVFRVRSAAVTEQIDAASEDDATAAFLDVAESDGPVSFTVEQTNPGPNRDAKRLVLTASDTTVAADPANDTYFVAVDAETVETDRGAFSYGDDYAARLEATSEDEANREVIGTASVSFVEREGSLETDALDSVYVDAAAGQRITGETTLAPGSEVTVRITSDDAESPFRYSPSATVRPDGTFEVTIDLGEEARGSDFTVSAIDPFDNAAFEGADEVPGRIGPEPIVIGPLPNGTVPNDLDDDEQFEDINGNGEGDLADAVALFQLRNDPAITDYADAYDFSGNGEIDLADVVDLFQEVTAA